MVAALRQDRASEQSDREGGSSVSNLYETVCRVRQQLDCPVIPLEGKRPARRLKSWIRYRHKPPDEDRLHEWFVDSETISYGIVLGRAANGLFVLDFDTQAAYRQFQERHRDYSDTFTVRTRRGYHVYLRSDKEVRSRRIRDGDLKAEGSYVVGPGSRVGECEYKVIRAGPVKQIAAAAVQALIEKIVDKPPGETKTEQAGSSTVKQIAVYYQQTARQIGRNNALYQTALQAKHQGISSQLTREILIPLHIKATPTGEHPAETSAQRRQEALHTIQSAYQTYGNLALATKTQPQEQGLLPNSIREALLQHTRSTACGRLLEGLLANGYRPEQPLTMTQLYENSQRYHISQRDVRQALHVTLAGQAVFPPVGEGDNLNSKRGRLYMVPSVAYLCDLLDVRVQASDPLSREDLSSAKAYRQALHRELIKRRAPEQSTTWHAQRLQVSARTVRRYNRELGVLRTPVIGYTPLNWQTVDEPTLYGSAGSARNFTPGQWLQRADGARFPALKGVALRELARRSALIACKQMPSRLQLPTKDQPVILHEALWRRLDQSPGQYWAGGLRDFPPLDSPESLPIREKKRSSQQSRVLPVAFCQAEPERPKPALSTAQRLVNHNLSLISGIGPRREEHLNRHGIYTMTQLIALGAEKLAALGWYGGYVTERTTLAWIERAEVLLGQRKPDHDPAYTERQRQQRAVVRRYKKHIKAYEHYLERVRAWEEEVFGPEGASCWSRELDWFKDYLALVGHDDNSLLHPIQVHTLCERVQTFTKAYLLRIDCFLAMGETALARWGFAQTGQWREMRRKTAAQLDHFEISESRLLRRDEVNEMT